MEIAVARTGSDGFNNKKNPFDHPSYKKLKDAFPTRKALSSSLLFGKSKDFKNVETFNLNPGYRLSRSAGKIYVSIQTRDPVPVQKTAPRKLSIAEMENLISNLREQADILSTYLEEERLRHGSTKKRAVLDLAAQAKKLSEEKEKEMSDLKEYHQHEIQLLEAQHEAKLEQFHKEHEEKAEKMQAEYRMLQASFKTYRSTLQDEMHDELKIKKNEFEWEKKRSVDDAVDNCKRVMEDKFSREREEMRKEFLKNMNEMIKQHRLELDKMAEKNKSEEEIRELERRSEQLTVAEEEIEKLKQEINEAALNHRLVASNLAETKKKLATLELQFDDNVRAVEDKHRSFIDNLRLEKADVTRRLIKSREDFQVEKMARENAEQQRKEAAISSLQKYFKSSEDQADSVGVKTQETTGVSRKSHDLTALMDEVTSALSGFDNSSLSTILGNFIEIIKKTSKKKGRKGRYQSQSIPVVSDTRIKSELEGQHRSVSEQFEKNAEAKTEEAKQLSDPAKRLDPTSKQFGNIHNQNVPNQSNFKSNAAKKFNPPQVVDAKHHHITEENTSIHHSRDNLTVARSLWDHKVLKSSLFDVVLNQTKRQWGNEGLKGKMADLIAVELKREWNSEDLQRKVGNILFENLDIDTDIEALKSQFADIIYNDTKQIWEVETMLQRLSDVVLEDLKANVASDKFKDQISKAISNDSKLCCCNNDTKTSIAEVVYDAVVQALQAQSIIDQIMEAAFKEMKQRSVDGHIQKILKQKMPNDIVLQLEDDSFRDITADLISKYATKTLNNEMLKQKVGLLIADQVNNFWSSESFIDKMTDKTVQDSAMFNDEFSLISSQLIAKTYTSKKFGADVVPGDSKLVFSEKTKEKDKKSISTTVDDLDDIASPHDSGTFMSSRLASSRKRGDRRLRGRKTKAYCQERRQNNDSRFKTDKSTSPLIVRSAASYEGIDRDEKNLSQMKLKTQPHYTDASSQGNSRWKGTFLTKDDKARPPIIFQVEKFKMLTANPPDSSNIAKKLIVNKNIKSSDVEDLAAVGSPISTNTRRSPSPS